MNKDIKKRIEEIISKYKGNIDTQFLLEELGRLEEKLVLADKMAVMIDVAVERKILDERSFIADARLIYGQPWKYEYITKKQLLDYRGGIPEVRKALGNLEKEVRKALGKKD